MKETGKRKDRGRSESKYKILFLKERKLNRTHKLSDVTGVPRHLCIRAQVNEKREILLSSPLSAPGVPCGQRESCLRTPRITQLSYGLEFYFYIQSASVGE